MRLISENHGIPNRLLEIPAMSEAIERIDHLAREWAAAESERDED